MRSLPLACSLTAAAVLLPTVARAQLTITGRVTAPDGAPVAGARVAIRDREVHGAITAADGRYQVEIPAVSLDGRTYRLVARATGYASAERPLTLRDAADTIDFRLEPDPLDRDALVETGVGSPVPASELSHSIGRVSRVLLRDVPAPTLLGGIQGKIPGVEVVSPTGDPALPPVVRLRGASNLSSIPSDPLLIIDGTVTRGSLADLAPDDVDRIEIAKGPVASALYGADAGNGVVAVFTRRGRDLPDRTLRITARNEVGSSSVVGRLPRAAAHPYQMSGGDFVRDANGRRVLEADAIADNPYPASFNQHDALYRRGLYFASHATLEGRRGGTGFAASFHNLRNEGTVHEARGYDRQNVRLNLDQRITRRLDLSLSGFRSWSDDDPVGDIPFQTWSFLEPHQDLLAENPDGTPYLANPPDLSGVNPLYFLANQDREESRRRTLGGARLRWRARDWLSVDAGYHLDREQREFSDLIPVGFLTPSGPSTNAFLTTEEARFRRYNTGLSVTATGSTGNLTRRVTLGYGYEDLRFDFHSRAEQIPLGSFQETARWDRVFSRAVYGTAALGWRGRYFADLAVRRDDFLSFPFDTDEWSWRVSGAWQAAADLGLDVDRLKLRAGYGRAPTRFDPSRFSPFLPPVFPVRPPITSELEAGLDLELAKGRVALEYTFAHRRVRDLLGTILVPAPIGLVEGLGSIGAIRSPSHELGVGLVLAGSQDLEVTVRLAGARSSAVITELIVPEHVHGGLSPVFLVREGARLGAMHGVRFVRTVDELYDDPAKAALSGPGETWDPAAFVVNEDGFVVRQADRNTPAERPIVWCRSDQFGSCDPYFEIGDATPDLNLSVATGFRFRGFRLSALADASLGGEVYNYARQRAYLLRTDPDVDQTGKPAGSRKAVWYYNWSLDGNLAFVESGSFLKLRELAVSYQLSLGAFPDIRLGLVGRNLLTVSSYSGYDPEVARVGTDPFLFRVDDGIHYPAVRTVSAMLEIAF